MLLAANQDSGCITCFRRDEKTGRLEPEKAGNLLPCTGMHCGTSGVESPTFYQSQKSVALYNHRLPCVEVLSRSMVRLFSLASAHAFFSAAFGISPVALLLGICAVGFFFNIFHGITHVINYSN